MRIVMMGTGPFAVPTFRALVRSTHHVLFLCTRPPARQQREAPGDAPMRHAAEGLGIPLYEPPDINASEAVERLAAAQAELLVVCDYGQILSADVLNTTRLGGINLHGSLLPRYRGAAPVNWAIYRGETVTGVSIIHMTPRLDAGPLLHQLAVEIEPDEDAVQLEGRLAEIGPVAVEAAIAQLAAWDGRTPIGARQPADQVTTARRLRKSDGQIDWRRSAQQIYNQIRAFKPWPGSFTQWLRPNRPPLRLIVDWGVAIGGRPTVSPGTVLDTAGQGLTVATGDGILRLDRLQPSGKKVMDAAAFVRGYPIRPGDRFVQSEA